jgi:hypothetical protein
MKCFFTIVAALLVGAVVLGADPQVPTQKIVGAEQPIPLGELVTLGVSPAGNVSGLKAVTYEWSIFDGFTKKSLAEDSKGKVFFGAGVKNKKLLAVVAATYVFDGGNGQYTVKTVQLNETVTIGGGDAHENPVTPAVPLGTGPVVPPTTPPLLPEGKYGLAQTAFNLALKVDATSRASAAQLAAAYDATAAKIKAGTLSGAKNILVALKGESDKALANKTDGWQDWAAGVGDVLFSLAQASKIQNDDDFATAFSEIATGLKGVK